MIRNEIRIGEVESYDELLASGQTYEAVLTEALRQLGELVFAAADTTGTLNGVYLETKEEIAAKSPPPPGQEMVLSDDEDRLLRSPYLRVYARVEKTANGVVAEQQTGNRQQIGLELNGIRTNIPGFFRRVMACGAESGSSLISLFGNHHNGARAIAVALRFGHRFEGCFFLWPEDNVANAGFAMTEQAQRLLDRELQGFEARTDWVSYYFRKVGFLNARRVKAIKSMLDTALAGEGYILTERQEFLRFLLRFLIELEGRPAARWRWRTRWWAWLDYVNAQGYDPSSYVAVANQHVPAALEAGIEKNLAESIAEFLNRNLENLEEAGDTCLRASRLDGAEAHFAPDGWMGQAWPDDEVNDYVVLPIRPGALEMPIGALVAVPAETGVIQYRETVLLSSLENIIEFYLMASRDPDRWKGFLEHWLCIAPPQ